MRVYGCAGCCYDGVALGNASQKEEKIRRPYRTSTATWCGRSSRTTSPTASMAAAASQKGGRGRLRTSSYDAHTNGDGGGGGAGGKGQAAALAASAMATTSCDHGFFLTAAALRRRTRSRHERRDRIVAVVRSLVASRRPDGWRRERLLETGQGSEDRAQASHWSRPRQLLHRLGRRRC